MGRKITIGVLLLVILIIINAVIGGILVFFIQDIHEPKIDVEFNLSQITTDEMRFTAIISMVNENQFDLLIKNLNIIGKTPDGNIILDLQIAGGTIAAQQQRLFTTNDTLSFDGELTSKIYGSIQGIFGVNFAGIFEKTIPFQINITASFQDLFNNISCPRLSILAEVTEITENGILFHGIISVENPNSFEMSLENFTTRIETENGNLVGEISQLQGNIIPNATSQFHLNGTLSYEALNAKIVTLRIVGNAGVHLMGIDKSIALSATAQLPIPEIKELLFHNESLGITISLDVKLRLSGFLTTIGLTLYNPSKIPLQANDLLCSIYGLTDGNQKMMAQKLMEPTSVEPTRQNYLETQLRIPYLKIFTSGTKKIFPDWFVIQIEGNFSLAGVNQSIPVSINATINPHLLRS
jgi:LEA14-like dessication related protein